MASRSRTESAFLLQSYNRIRHWILVGRHTSSTAGESRNWLHTSLAQSVECILCLDRSSVTKIGTCTGSWLSSDSQLPL